MTKKSKSNTKTTNEESESKPIVIAKKPPFIYAWAMLLEFQRYKTIKLHAHPSNQAAALNLISLFSVFDKELKEKRFVKTTNLSNDQELEVVEFELSDKRRSII